MVVKGQLNGGVQRTDGLGHVRAAYSRRCLVGTSIARRTCPRLNFPNRGHERVETAREQWRAAEQRPR